MMVGSPLAICTFKLPVGYSEDRDELTDGSSDFADAVDAHRRAVDDPFHVQHGSGMGFEVLGAIWDIETFATGSGIREVARLRKVYGAGRWRKRKGLATVLLPDGSVHLAEVHWYEASAFGRKELKIKRLLS